ncbi:MAG: hypothetical protein ACKVOW_01330, partial [Chitinophagaceae bacterium]
TLLSTNRNSWLYYIMISGNGTLTQSKVFNGPIKNLESPTVKEHTLSGTPDYTLNGSLTLQYPGFPHLSVLYNRIGDYILYVGSGQEQSLSNGNKISSVPSYRVKEREQLDIQLSQTFLKSKIQIIAGVTNLLATAYTEYQDLNGNEKFDTPLSTTNSTSGGYFKSGVDNTVLQIKGYRNYFLRISFYL